MAEVVQVSLMWSRFDVSRVAAATAMSFAWPGKTSVCACMVCHVSSGWVCLLGARKHQEPKHTLTETHLEFSLSTAAIKALRVC